MPKIRQWKCSIGGKIYYFEAHTIKLAQIKGKRLAGAICKIIEVK